MSTWKSMLPPYGLPILRIELGIAGLMVVMILYLLFCTMRDLRRERHQYAVDLDHFHA